MTIALEIGASRLRSLRREDQEVIGRSLPAAFALVDDNPAARDLLCRAELAFAMGDGELALIGDAALDHAGAFRTAPHRLLRDGLVPTDDPLARQLLAALVESLLPVPDYPGELCGLVMSPAAMRDRDSRSFLLRLAQARGYDPISLSPSLALMLATFSAENFSGIGMTFGASGCSLSLVHRGRELLQVSEGRGTDWIDLELAARADLHTYDDTGDRYLDIETVRRRREELGDSLIRPQGDFATDCAELHREILHTTLARLAQELADKRLGPYALEAPLICSGGAVQTAGFGKLLRATIEQAELPVPLGPIRLAAQDDYLITRGALIHAEIETTTAAAA